MEDKNIEKQAVLEVSGYPDDIIDYQNAKKDQENGHTLSITEMKNLLNTKKP